MEEIRHRIVGSINEIDRSDWDRVFGDIPEGYGFYKTVEEANLEDFEFYYLLLYRDGRVVLIAPLFATEFEPDIAMEGLLKKIILVIRGFMPNFFTLRTLFVGSVFSENGILGIDKNFTDSRRLIREATVALEEFAARKRLEAVIFKDFTDADCGLLSETLKERDFFTVESFPSVITDLGFGSLDEYLGSLSHSTRKDLRRKLKKARQEAKITVDVVDDAGGMIDDIYRLYLNSFNAATVKFEKLSKKFFVDIAGNLKGRAKFFLYYVNGRLAAFNLCFVYDDLLIDKFIGFDFDVSRRYGLYFLSWCFNVEWCIKNSIHRYQTGQTDYSPKMRLGGRLVPLYICAKHSNAFLNRFFAFASRFLKPGPFR
jgi:predicted N-acyltransferase